MSKPTDAEQVFDFLHAIDRTRYAFALGKLVENRLNDPSTHPKTVEAAYTKVMSLSCSTTDGNISSSREVALYINKFNDFYNNTNDSKSNKQKRNKKKNKKQNVITRDDREEEKNTDFDEEKNFGALRTNRKSGCRGFRRRKIKFIN